MKRKKFFEPVVCPLGNKILKCLGEVNLLNNDTPFLRSALIDYRDTLTSYLKEPSYKDVDNGIKRQVRLVLRTIIDKLTHTPAVDENNIYAQECLIQIPSSKQITEMKGMSAGGKEDQSERLSHMADEIKSFSATHPLLSIVTANEVELPPYWHLLFNTIDHGNLERARQIMQEIAKSKDDTADAILAVHSLNYLLNLICHCIDSQKNGHKKIEADSIVTPKTFELLIKDIASTIRYATPLYFSFGLPTHHAYADHSKGFCLLNKTAILIRYLQNKSKFAIKFLVVGTDVNSDNGLRHILMTQSFAQVCHFDIFDPRVYPNQNFSMIEKELNHNGIDVVPGVKRWSKNSYDYYALALNLMPRPNNVLHPCIHFVLLSITNCLVEAKQNQTKVAILLPTGWDSHQAETAYCGKFVNNHYMNQQEAERTRFSNTDLLFFYRSLFELYNTYRDQIMSIYWGLEGGYEPTLYQQQIPILLSLIEKQLADNVHVPKCLATSSA